jgi:RNA-directed DNA polymerase
MAPRGGIEPPTVRRQSRKTALTSRPLRHSIFRKVVDADLADYFGSIPHAEFLKSVSRRIVDRRVLHLIKMWLDCPVEETDDRGRRTRTTEARDKRRGIQQGSPLSPLLANVYMRRFVLGWKMFGLERTLGARLVTYADDLVILCRRGRPKQPCKACARSWAS